ncbi:hypothetical protein LXL04_003888 [Taraxacum kok-saghyz]
MHMGLAPQIRGMVTASRPVTFGSTKSVAVRSTNPRIRHGSMAQKADSLLGENNKRKSWEISHNKDEGNATSATVLDRDDAFGATRQTQLSIHGPSEIPRWDRSNSLPTFRYRSNSVTYTTFHNSNPKECLLDKTFVFPLDKRSLSTRLNVSTAYPYPYQKRIQRRIPRRIKGSSQELCSLMFPSTNLSKGRLHLI